MEGCLNCFILRLVVGSPAISVHPEPLKWRHLKLFYEIYQIVLHLLVGSDVCLLTQDPDTSRKKVDFDPKGILEVIQLALFFELLGCLVCAIDLVGVLGASFFHLLLGIWSRWNMEI